jgi:hypothetical protein
VVSKAEEYRQHAQQCLDAAQRIQNAEERAIMLQIAQRWIHLAEEQDATSSSTEPAQQPQQQQQVQPAQGRQEGIGHLLISKVSNIDQTAKKRQY